MQMNKSVKALCEAAIMIAIALVIDLLKDVLPGQLPDGGSLLNVSMLPIVFFAIRYGAGWGAMAGFVFGTLNYIIGNGIAITWFTIICDYPLAFCLLGLGAGLFKGRKWGAIWGSLLGGGLQFLSSYLVGVFVWGEYMPEEFLGLHMVTPWIYSFLYNILWAAPNIALTIVIFLLLYRVNPIPGTLWARVRVR